MPYAWYAGENSGMKILAGQQGEECQNAWNAITRIRIKDATNN